MTDDEVRDSLREMCRQGLLGMTWEQLDEALALEPYPTLVARFIESTGTPRRPYAVLSEIRDSPIA